MNLVNGVYLLNEVIGVNGVTWENGMNLANVGYVVNGGEFVKWD